MGCCYQIVIKDDNKGRGLRAGFLRHNIIIYNDDGKSNRKFSPFDFCLIKNSNLKFQSFLMEQYFYIV